MTKRRDQFETPIAIVGVSALFPGSLDSTGFWSDIFRGVDLLEEVPPTHWLLEDFYDPDPKAPDKTYTTRGAFLQDIDFDPLAWGIPPSIVEATDTSQLLALIVAQRVLDEASQGQFAAMDRSRISVILGVTSGQELLGTMASRLQRPVWQQGLRQAGVPEDQVQEACDRIAAHYVEWQESTFPGLLGNVVAGRIANRLDLGGTNCVTDAACASSFSALAMGVSELRLGSSDMVITGGVDTMNDIFMYMCFSKTPALSRTGDIRPFSADADGTMLGEGIGMVALKRLSDAERDGDRVYALLHGIGSSSDGRSKSVYAPVSEGQANALRRAYTQAGYSSDTIELVEAHGTATFAGDAAEFGGLRSVFEETDRTDQQWCALGSVKSQIGHTKAAAGAAGLFKVIMALHHKVLPPTIKIDTPNPSIEIETSPFYLNTESRPWVRGTDHPRRASVSSFGFGGSNFHLTLSEPTGNTPPPARLRSFSHELVTLTGESGAKIAASAHEHAAEAATPGFLAWLAQSSRQSYRADAGARLAVVATDEADLRDKLEKAAEKITACPDESFDLPGIHYGTGPQLGTHEIAFLFPGQGSQYPGMGAPLAMQFDAAIAAWDLAADADWAAQPLHEVVFPHPVFTEEARKTQEATLTLTHWAQPAIGTMSLSILNLLRKLGITPAHTGGHSFGEVTALHAGGVLSGADMIRTARTRGLLMAEAADTPGAMTAVSRPVEEVRALVESWKENGASAVVLANHNSPTQIVLSGPTPAIEEAEKLLAEAGMKAKRLTVATAFHSPVVSNAAGAFHNALQEISFTPPTIPIYANETTGLYSDDPQEIRSQLGRQLACPVRFVEMVEKMYENGARVFVEVGPAATLTGLTGKILADRPHRAVALDRKPSRKKQGQDATTSLKPFLEGLATLAAAGTDMDLGALDDEYAVLQNPHELPKQKMSIPLSGANYGRPYPPADLSEIAGPNPPQQETRSQVSRAAAEASATAQTMPTPPSPAQTMPTPPSPLAPAASSHTNQPGTHTPALVHPAPAPFSPTHIPTASLPPILSAFQTVQQQTADAHRSYLSAVAQSHNAFLQAAQSGFDLLSQLASGTPSAQPQQPLASTTSFARSAFPQPTSQTANLATLPPAPSSVPQPPVESTHAFHTPDLFASPAGGTVEYTQAVYPEQSPNGDTSVPVVSPQNGTSEITPTAFAPAPALAATPATDTPAAVPFAPVTLPTETPSTETPPAAPLDITQLLLDTVSDKTGYPAEMLTMEMELESDLGIDSIKRVEILSAIQETVPELPEVDTSVLAELQTLAQIVEYMENATDSATSATSTSTAPLDDTPADIPENAPADTLDTTVGLHLVQTRETEAPGRPLQGLTDGINVAITDDGKGIAYELAQLLTANQMKAEVVTDLPADGIEGIIFLDGLRSFEKANDALTVNRTGFSAAKAIASRAAQGSGVFVSVQDTGGAFGSGAFDPLRAWSAGLSGLARTLALEWPASSVKTIDIEQADRAPEVIAAAIAEELFTGGNDLNVGLRAGGPRLTLSVNPTERKQNKPLLGAQDVIVVSGGGRGVTAAAVVALAKETGASFALLGRTELLPEPEVCQGVEGDAALKQALLAESKKTGTPRKPAELGRLVKNILAGREIQTTLAHIEAVGGRAQYLPVNITSKKAVAEALKKVRSDWGPLTGVVHGAGVLADKLMTDKTKAQFDKVFNTKVQGALHLVDATSQDPLRLLCFFSSVAAVAGNPGQADYAMANEVLNKVALAERRQRDTSCVVKALNWGPWAGGMVTPELESHFRAMGVSLIPLDEGAEIFVEEMADTSPDRTELVIGNGLLPSWNTGNNKPGSSQGAPV